MANDPGQSQVSPSIITMTGALNVVITQNREKDLSAVIGQHSTVYTVHKNTILLRLSNNNIVQTHLVMCCHNEGQSYTVYPENYGNLNHSWCEP